MTTGPRTTARGSAMPDRAPEVISAILASGNGIMRASSLHTSLRRPRRIRRLRSRGDDLAVVEREHLARDVLALLVALAGHDDDVAAPGPADRQVDRRRAVGLNDHMSAVVLRHA